MNTRTPAALAAVGALALALAACGGDAGTTSAADEREPLPLDAYWEGLYGEYDEERGSADQIRQEELIAECMTTEGFDYTPVDYSSMGGGIAYSSDDLDVDWGSREFAEQYGYGATTNPWGEIEEPLPEETGEEWVDPNWEYVETMSESEQEAYYLALYGDQSMFEDFTDEDWETYEWNWEDGGCQGWASNEVYGDMMGSEDSEHEALWDDLSAMWEAAQQDPRLTGAMDQWRACMADAGYPGFVELWDAQEYIYDQTNDIYNSAYSDDLDWETMTEADFAAIEEGIQAPLAEITDEEIALALIDYDCQESSGYRDAEYEVNFEYQTEFLATHGAELEAYAASQR